MSVSTPSGPAEKVKYESVEGYDKFTPKAIMCLFGSWFSHLMVGAQYAWGNMLPYVVSYFRNTGVEDATTEKFYFILTCIVVVSTLFFPTGMSLTAKLGSKNVILLGGSILTTCTLLVSFFPHTLTFFILYAGGFGIAKGFLYPAPLKASWSHLPGRKGLVSGTVTQGLGCGSFLYGMLVNQLVNPDNKSPDPDTGIFEKEISDRVPYAFRILAFCWGAQTLIAYVLVNDYVKKEEVHDDHHWEDFQKNKLIEMEKKAPLRKIICSREFFSLYFISVTEIFFGYFIMTKYKVYGAGFIKDDQFLTLIGSIGSLLNGLFRIFWAGMLDYFPFKKINTVLLLLLTIVLFTVQAAVHNKYTYLVVVALAMKCEGAMAAIVPTLCLKKFGITRGHQVFSFVYSSYGIASLTGSVLNATIGVWVGFEGMVYVGGLFVVAACVLTYRQDDNHMFNYAKLYPDETTTYGDTYSSKAGKQVRDLGTQVEVFKAPRQADKKSYAMKTTNIHKIGKDDLNRSMR